MPLVNARLPTPESPAQARLQQQLDEFFRPLVTEVNQLSSITARRISIRGRIVNTAGTIQHRIGAIGSATAPSAFASQISGASVTLTNTPTGADATTAFASGAKIGSANPSQIWFDTNEQSWSLFGVAAVIVYNSSGTSLNIVPAALSLNINGVTRTRFVLQFVTNPAGVDYNLTTLGVGQIIDFTVEGYVQ